MSNTKKGYTFGMGADYSTKIDFKVKKLTFNLLDKVTPLIENINKLKAIDYSEYSQDEKSPINNLQMLQDQILSKVNYENGTKKLLSKDENKKYISLMIELFRLTIADDTSKKYIDEMNNDEFFYEQDMKGLEENLVFFRSLL